MTFWNALERHWQWLVAGLIVLALLLIWITDTGPSAYRGPIRYEMMKVHNGEYEMPMVVDFPDKVVEDKVNRQLRKIGESLGCYRDDDTVASLQRTAQWLGDTLQDKSESEINSLTVEQLRNYIYANADFNVKSKVEYAANGILSLAIATQGYCGGAYPFFNEDPITFDMDTGDALSFESLFANYGQDKVSINSMIMADVWAQRDAQRAGADDTCRARYDALQPDMIYYLAHDGLHITPSFPHVSQACGEEVVEPMQKLAQFFDSKSILSRVRSLGSIAVVTDAPTTLNVYESNWVDVLGPLPVGRSANTITLGTIASLTPTSFGPAFVGSWKWQERGAISYPPDYHPSEGLVWDFELHLANKENKLVAAWYSVYDNGRRIDECNSKSEVIPSEICGTFTLDAKNSGTFSFIDSCGGQGIAQITYDPKNDSLHWKITTPPSGEYYLPDEATLTRIH